MHEHDMVYDVPIHALMVTSRFLGANHVHACTTESNFVHTLPNIADGQQHMCYYVTYTYTIPCTRV